MVFLSAIRVQSPVMGTDIRVAVGSSINNPNEEQYDELGFSTPSAWDPFARRRVREPSFPYLFLGSIACTMMMWTTCLIEPCAESSERSFYLACLLNALGTWPYSEAQNASSRCSKVALRVLGAAVSFGAPLLLPGHPFIRRFFS